jgi:hypothetical protein
LRAVPMPTTARPNRARRGGVGTLMRASSNPETGLCKKLHGDFCHGLRHGRLSTVSKDSALEIPKMNFVREIWSAHKRFTGLICSVVIRV